MTRKRFVKLLMSAGIDRNVANGNAGLVQLITGMSYREWYAEIMTPVIERDA